MRGLLLSAYAAQSHEHWRRSLQAMADQWQWRALTLPPRHFSWRVRGNPLFWALAERAVLEEPYDLLVATSMVDLATLRGLVPGLGRLPAVVYFHENQFAYPPSRSRHGSVEAQLTSLYSGLAADGLLFNSDYNRRSYLDGCTELLDRLPDRVPAGVVEQLQDRARVLPVPIDDVDDGDDAGRWPGPPNASGSRPVRLLWVGRLEHDKGGDGLYRLLGELERSDLHYELALVGRRFREMPPVFDHIQRQFGHRLVQFGHVDCLDDYHALLRGGDIVVSTALHEFQGLAVMEAVARGCLPVLPDRLAYAEFYPAHCRYRSSPEAPDREAAAAAALVLRTAAGLRTGSARAPDLTHCTRSQLAPRYAAYLAGVAGHRDSQ